MINIGVIIIAAGLMFAYANHQDQSQKLIASCIVETANANHYPFPHSQEAWKLFYDQCVN